MKSVIYFYVAVACHKIAGYLIDVNKDLLDEARRHNVVGSFEESRRLLDKVKETQDKITKWQDRFDYFIERV